MLRAGIALRKGHGFAVDHINRDKAAGQAQGRLNRIGKAAAHLIIHHKAVYHDFNRMLVVLFQLNFFIQLVQVSIHPYTRKPAARRGLKLFYMGTFAAAHYRGEYLKTRALWQFQNVIHHLVYRLLADLPATNGAMRDTDTSIQQTQVVVNFRHGAHGRTRVARSGFLVNRNRR
ncbi:hypothetical protein SDC9_142240 [bioreactor metagenome]|uniref:Uncharacterized protein n=1 Tax=bioreactor metagenome TaxID=1076179 RepID=A0A645E0M1_9ZZZZ